MELTREQLLKAKIPCPETGIEVKHTLCDICCPGTHCGVDAYVKDAQIIKVEGTDGHPFNEGKLCPKGSANRQYIYRKDRIHTPLRRVGERGEGKFEPISWDEAYREIADRLLDAKARYGADSVAFFSGFTKWYRQYLHRFAYSFGSINYGSECSSCWKSTEMAWMSTTGTITDPDFGNSNVILGCPLHAFYSMHVAGPALLALKDMGKKFIIVDPRKTPATDKLADIHLQLKPGTDGALALGMAKIIIDNGWQDKEFVEKYTYGFEQYAAEVKKYDLKKVAGITGLDPRDIERATELYSTGGPASIHESPSPVTHHTNGFQNYRAILCLNALTGNFDRAGGNLPVTATYYDQCAGYHTYEHEYYLERLPGDPMTKIGAQRFPLWSKLVPEFQAMDLARQINEGTPYPIKALFCMGLNAKMFPDTPAFYEALRKVDFFVDTDLFLTDTAKYADIVLPACSSFERGEFKAYPGGFAAYTKPVIPPLYESRSDTDILRDLAELMELDDPLLREGYEAAIRYMIRDTGVTVEELQASDMPVHVPTARDTVPGEFLANGIKTPTGKFEFYSTTVAEFQDSHGLSPVPTYSDTLADEPDADAYPFVLNTGARLPNTLHSRLHDVPWLRSMRKTPMADISLEDAARLDLREGDMVELYNSVGAIRVAVCPTGRVRAGDIHLYHGYRECNANNLVGACHLDPYSGFPGYKSNRCGMKKI